MPDAVGAERFTIGRVMTIAWRGFARRAAYILVLCGAGGLLAAYAARQIALTPAFKSHPYWSAFSNELSVTLIALIFLAPAILLLLGACRAEEPQGPKTLALALRRCGMMVPVQLTADILVVLPPYVILPMLPAHLYWVGQLAIFFIYQLPILTFNCILRTALLDGGEGPIRGAARALALISGNWGRMALISITLEIFGGILVILQPTATLLLLEWLGIYYVWLADAALFSLRLVVAASITAAAYHLLQRQKDGGTPEQMARVFD